MMIPARTSPLSADATTSLLGVPFIAWPSGPRVSGGNRGVYSPRLTSSSIVHARRLVNGFGGSLPVWTPGLPGRRGVNQVDIVRVSRRAGRRPRGRRMPGNVPPVNPLPWRSTKASTRRPGWHTPCYVGRPSACVPRGTWCGPGGGRPEKGQGFTCPAPTEARNGATPAFAAPPAESPRRHLPLHGSPRNPSCGASAR